MRTYEAPELFVDEYVADTMIASTIGGTDPKSGNPDNNQNCWACRYTAGAPDPYSEGNLCLYLPGTKAYEEACK